MAELLIYLMMTVIKVSEVVPTMDVHCCHRGEA